MCTRVSTPRALSASRFLVVRAASERCGARQHGGRGSARLFRARRGGARRGAGACKAPPAACAAAGCALAAAARAQLRGVPGRSRRAGRGRARLTRGSRRAGQRLRGCTERVPVSYMPYPGPRRAPRQFLVFRAARERCGARLGVPAARCGCFGVGAALCGAGRRGSGTSGVRHGCVRVSGERLACAHGLARRLARCCAGLGALAPAGGRDLPRLARAPGPGQRGTTTALRCHSSPEVAPDLPAPPWQARSASTLGSWHVHYVAIVIVDRSCSFTYVAENERQRMSTPKAALPTPIKGSFSTGLFDCCAEPLGTTGCLYYTFCFGCAAGDMAVKMATGEVDRPKVKTPDCLICCGDRSDDWTGYPWINPYTQCCGFYCGACFLAGYATIGPNGRSAFDFTMTSLRSVQYTYGLQVNRCEYCLLSSCCCCNLCIQLQIDRELIIRSQHRKRAASGVQMTEPPAQTMAAT